MDNDNPQLPDELGETVESISNDIEEGYKFLDDEKYEEASELFAKTLAQCENLPAESLLTFGALRGLSISYAGLNEITKLAPLVDRWVEVGEAQLGKWHPETAYAYSMLGLVKEEQGDFDEAINMHERAINILEKSEAGYEQGLINAIDELSGFYMRRKRLEVGQALLQKIIGMVDTFEEFAEADKMEYLIRLVDVSLLSGDFQNMEPVCRRVLSYVQENDQTYAWYPLAALACCFCSQGKYAEGEVAFERVLELIDQAGLEHNEGFRRIFDAYGEALTKAGRDEDALFLKAKARRLVYEQFEVNAEEDEVKADGVGFTFLADVLYRLESPELVLDINEETEAAYKTEIRKLLFAELQDFFAEQDFLEVYLNLGDIEKQIKTRLEQVFARKGFGIVFRFREFSDSEGFLEVIGKLQAAAGEVESGNLSVAESIYEEAIEEAKAFPRSQLLEYVTEEYADYLERIGEIEKAQEVRRRQD